jgi:hypothetical protein
VCFEPFSLFPLLYKHFSWCTLKTGISSMGMWIFMFPEIPQNGRRTFCCYQNFTRLFFSLVASVNWDKHQLFSVFIFISLTNIIPHFVICLSVFLFLLFFFQFSIGMLSSYWVFFLCNLDTNYLPAICVELAFFLQGF